MTLAAVASVPGNGGFLLLTAAILAGAGVASVVAARWRLPSVALELVVGLIGASWIAVAPTSWLGALLDQARGEASHVAGLAEIGILLLMFEVGLESRLSRLLGVGGDAARVALVGIVLPFALGALSCALFPHAYPANLPHWHVNVFVGASMAATSVGVAARVFRDLGRADTRAGRIVLGAAVLDDVLALIALAVVGAFLGAAGSTGGSGAAVAGTVAVALFGAIGMLGVGIGLAPRLVHRAHRAGGPQLALIAGLVICLAFAHLAGRFGLAPIVGAFLAGLALDNPPRREASPANPTIRPSVSSLVKLLAPFFFVVVGLRVDVSLLSDGRMVLFGLFLSVGAFAGKLLCGAVVRASARDRWIIGLAMVPRGEVLIVFAAIGRTMNVIDRELFAGLVVTMLVTTLIPPPILGLLLRPPAPRANGSGAQP